jgi:hypothetical protein
MTVNRSEMASDNGQRLDASTPLGFEHTGDSSADGEDTHNHRALNSVAHIANKVSTETPAA